MAGEVLENGLEAELDDELGYSKYDYRNKDTDNSRKAKNSKSKSLAQLIKSDKYSDISYGIKFCAGNIGFENNIYTFPYYCTFLLKRYLIHNNTHL